MVKSQALTEFWLIKSWVWSRTLPKVGAAGMDDGCCNQARVLYFDTFMTPIKLLDTNGY